MVFKIPINRKKVLETFIKGNKVLVLDEKKVYNWLQILKPFSYSVDFFPNEPISSSTSISIQ